MGAIFSTCDCFRGSIYIGICFLLLLVPESYFPFVSLVCSMWFIGYVSSWVCMCGGKGSCVYVVDFCVDSIVLCSVALVANGIGWFICFWGKGFFYFFKKMFWVHMCFPIQ